MKNVLSNKKAVRTRQEFGTNVYTEELMDPGRRYPLKPKKVTFDHYDFNNSENNIRL